MRSSSRPLPNRLSTFFTAGGGPLDLPDGSICARAHVPGSAPAAPLAAPADLLWTSLLSARCNRPPNRMVCCVSRYSALKKGGMTGMSPHTAQPCTWPARHSCPFAHSAARGWLAARPCGGTGHGGTVPPARVAAPGRCRSACNPSAPAPTQTPGARAPPGCARAATPPAARALGECTPCKQGQQQARTPAALLPPLPTATAHRAKQAQPGLCDSSWSKALWSKA